MLDMEVALLISADLLPQGNALNGRRWAAQSWLRHWCTTDSAETLSLLCTSSTPATLQLLQPVLRQLGWTKAVQLLDLASISALDSQDLIFIPDPSIGRWANWRQQRGATACSLVGQIHTISSAASLSLLEALVTEPVEPWDALVCSSTAGRDVVVSLMNDREDQLCRRAGCDVAQLRQRRPQLPVIPLPIDVEVLQHLPGKAEARDRLGVPQSASVVLWLGRLSMLTKLDPWPTYLCLERVAQQLGHPLVLLECGPDDTHFQAAHFAELRQLCPSLHFCRLGGSEHVAESVKHLALAAADLAISLVDNTQETFGLSVAEAMAAGLPLVVSDWNGYRDLVQHGVHGFRVPTRWAKSASLVSSAMAWQHLWGMHEFPAHAGALAQLVHVDIHAAEQDLLTLLSQPALAQAMGQAAQREAARRFTGSVVMEQHRALFAELQDRRNAAPVHPSGPPPLSLDPVQCFAAYASEHAPVSHPLDPVPPCSVVSRGRSELWQMLQSLVAGVERDNLVQDIYRKHS